MQHLDRVMRRINDSMHQKIPRIDTNRVGPLGTKVLTILADNEPASIKEIGTLMARDKSQMTRAVGALESKGLIKREESPHDARVGLISLTVEGRTFVEAVKQIMSEVVDEVIEPLSPGEIKQLSTILGKL